MKLILYLNLSDRNANFVLIKVDNANRRYDQLIAKGIVIRNRTTQPLCENTLRLTIGTAEENKVNGGIEDNLNTKFHSVILKL
jgi:histidinol-phosphate/aromatic aminotransferase/cobyric acid decarboxylase-like protein